MRRRLLHASVDFQSIVLERSVCGTSLCSLTSENEFVLTTGQPPMCSFQDCVQCVRLDLFVDLERLSEMSAGVEFTLLLQSIVFAPAKVLGTNCVSG